MQYITTVLKLHLAARDFLKASQLLLKGLVSCCVVQCFGWITKVVGVGNLCGSQMPFISILLIKFLDMQTERVTGHTKSPNV